MQDDPRKQPTQAVRVWHGFVPAGTLGDNPDRDGPVAAYRYLFPSEP
jgi:hypothetical protein